MSAGDLLAAKHEPSNKCRKEIERKNLYKKMKTTKAFGSRPAETFGG